MQLLPLLLRTGAELLWQGTKQRLHPVVIGGQAERLQVLATFGGALLQGVQQRLQLVVAVS